jgi:hypothetical protein
MVSPQSSNLSESSRSKATFQVLKRTNTIFIAEETDVPSPETAVYVDIEGIPDQKLYYLLGLRVTVVGVVGKRFHQKNIIL